MNTNSQATKIIKDYFIKPLLEKENGKVGVELEFPLINLNKEPVDVNIAEGLLKYFTENGFKAVEYTTDNKPAFIMNKDNDVLSFDNSYNNFEFSMNYGENLKDIKTRFEKLYSMTLEYLAPYNYVVAGLGTNPYKKYTKQLHVSFPVYNMVDEFLHRYNCEKTHEYPDFPAYLSSAQTHLDISAKNLPKTATLFAKIDFARASLFSNSLNFEMELPLCFRDYLWEKSAFGLLEENTGKVCADFKNLEDIENDYLKRKMFNRVRNGKYETFDFVSVEDYFNEGYPEEDIECYLSFKNIEITHRGTLEVRSDCAQNIDEAFLPAVFSLGLSANTDEAILCTEMFFKENKIKENNEELREAVIWKRSLPFSGEKFSEFLTALTDCAKTGLVKRGFGEEELIKPLYNRAKNLVCPAVKTLEAIQNGKEIYDIIMETIPAKERERYKK